jgi:hypothetical protein
VTFLRILAPLALLALAGCVGLPACNGPGESDFYSDCRIARREMVREQLGNFGAAYSQQQAIAPAQRTCTYYTVGDTVQEMCH